MKIKDQIAPANPQPAARAAMNGKPVYQVPAKSVLNLESGFSHKLLCDGPTFSTGSACVYSCAFCYVPDLMRKNQHMNAVRADGRHHEDVVIRREGAIPALRRQLTFADGSPRFPDPADRRVIYSSPLVDVAGNMELVRETVEACTAILELTHWQIRLLSKSNLLPKIAEALSTLDSHFKADSRLIYGVSTGTLDDKLAVAFEQRTPFPSKRIASLHWLQDRGFRTYGMICPSLPQRDYHAFALEMAEAIRAERCEHVWAEVINVRGESMRRTVAALHSAGFEWEAAELERVSSDKIAWENYARTTFLAHASIYNLLGPAASTHPATKLRFLQYVTASSRVWWQTRVHIGAILL